MLARILHSPMVICCSVQVRPIRTLRMLKDVRIVVAVIEDSMHLFLTVRTTLLAG
jgi:hypothetical protein|eukprot:COSAG01_NODE_27161_length_692_cov_8.180438_1_plen_55_part_00